MRKLKSKSVAAPKHARPLDQALVLDPPECLDHGARTPPSPSMSTRAPSSHVADLTASHFCITRPSVLFQLRREYAADLQLPHARYRSLQRCRPPLSAFSSNPSSSSSLSTPSLSSVLTHTEFQQYDQQRRLATAVATAAHLRPAPLSDSLAAQATGADTLPGICPGSGGEIHARALPSAT
jgi:hypothetical protein